MNILEGRVDTYIISHVFLLRIEVHVEIEKFIYEIRLFDRKTGKNVIFFEFSSDCKLHVSCGCLNCPRPNEPTASLPTPKSKIFSSE